MEGIEFLEVTLTFAEPVTPEQRLSLDLGGITLRRGDRSYLLDIVRSCLTNDRFVLSCDVEEDREELTDSNYDLTQEDLILYPLDEATVYIGCEYLEAPSYITLFVKSGGLTKAIDLTIE